MCAIRKIEMRAGNALKSFEKKTLERSNDRFLLPVTLTENADGMHLLYRTDGCTALSAYTPRGLSEVFRVARSFIAALTEGENLLLAPRRFFVSPDCVYIHDASTRVRLMFGDDGADRESDADSVLPVLRTLADLRCIVGARSAIGRIMEQIRNTNPGFADMRKIVEITEREWAYIHPGG